MQILTKKQKKNLESLHNLCRCLGIDLGSGWQKGLAATMGVTESTVSQWIRRGISKTCRETADRLGCDPQSWWVPYGRPQYAEDQAGADPWDTENQVTSFAQVVGMLEEINSDDPTMMSIVKAMLQASHLATRRHKTILCQADCIQTLNTQIAELAGRLAALEHQFGMYHPKKSPTQPLPFLYLKNNKTKGKEKEG